LTFFHIFTVTVLEDSAGSALKLIRGSNCFPDATPTVWIAGDDWPPYAEVVTGYPLHGASKLNVSVNCVKGESELTFGLIFPDERYL